MHRTAKEELHLKMLIYAFTSEKEREIGASRSSFIFQIQNVQLFKETQQKEQLYCVVVAAHKGAHSFRFGSSKLTKKKNIFVQCPRLDSVAAEKIQMSPTTITSTTRHFCDHTTFICGIITVLRLQLLFNAAFSLLTCIHVGDAQEETIEAKIVQRTWTKPMDSIQFNSTQSTINVSAIQSFFELLISNRKEIVVNTSKNETNDSMTMNLTSLICKNDGKNLD